MLTKAKKKILTEAIRPLVKSVLIELAEAEKKGKKKKVKARVPVEEDDDDDLEEDDDDLEEDEEEDDEVEEGYEDDDEDEDEDDEDDMEGDLKIIHKDEEECDTSGKKKKRMKESVDEVALLRRKVNHMERATLIQARAAKLGVKLKKSVLEGLIEMPPQRAKLFLTEMAGQKSGPRSGRMLEDDSDKDAWLSAFTEGVDGEDTKETRTSLVGLLTN